MLSTGDQDSIKKMFAELRGEAKALVKQLVQITFYMRGGVQYSDLLLNRTRAEREIMFDFVEENIKSQKGNMSIVY